MRAPPPRLDFGTWWLEGGRPVSVFAKGSRPNLGRSTLVAVLGGAVAVEASYANGETSWICVLGPGDVMGLDLESDIAHLGPVVLRPGPARLVGLDGLTVGELQDDVRIRLADATLRTQQHILRFAAIRGMRWPAHRICALMACLDDSFSRDLVLLGQRDVGRLTATSREYVNFVVGRLAAAGAADLSERAVRVADRDDLNRFLTELRPGLFARSRRQNGP